MGTDLLTTATISVNAKTEHYPTLTGAGLAR
jgi:hypothetical protein